MVHAARALGLRVMIGCMVESQLAVAPAAQIASLADWVDLDGHLLLAEQPFTGLELERRRGAARTRPGPRAGARVSDESSRSSPRACSRAHSGKTAHGVIRYGTREVVAVIDSTHAGRDARPRSSRSACSPCPIVATLAEAIERGADALLIGVAPTGGKLDPAWRAALLEAIDAGLDLEAGLHTQLADDPELRAAADAARRRAARPARRAARPRPCRAARHSRDPACASCTASARTP